MGEVIGRLNPPTLETLDEALRRRLDL